eukprot:scaffold1429_cov110-Cylindrotheca_fusiformis.AAC.13
MDVVLNKSFVVLIPGVSFTLLYRRGFMQETLNKMVGSVRHGHLGPEDASRTIHECAALLGLQLASEIPVTTLIVTGMRKTVSARDMRDAFGEFGQISEAAVAPNKRDFGILRFTTNEPVRLVMEKLRVGEIVVQDVAVNVRTIQAGPSQTNVAFYEAGTHTKKCPFYIGGNEEKVEFHVVYNPNIGSINRNKGNVRLILESASRQRETYSSLGADIVTVGFRAV